VPLVVKTPPGQWSVAQSWNAGIGMLQDPQDMALVANDDIKPCARMLEALVAAATDSPTTGLLAPKRECIFSCFLMRRWLIDAIGPFDEQFWPAYYEDNDFHRRMRLAGHDEQIVEGVGYEHSGSSTLNMFSSSRLEDHHEQFRANRARYMRKWGGLPGQERFTVPYGGLK